jgi:ubiquitin-protein ligase
MMSSLMIHHNDELLASSLDSSLFNSRNLIQNSVYYVNDTVKKYLKKLYEETMLKKWEMYSNVSIIFDSTKGHLIVEYIGYKGTDFHNGQYFILIELPVDYPLSPPKISVLTKSGRFHVKTHLSMSISHYHKKSWYPMPLTFLVINIISAFSDYTIKGIGHIMKKQEELISDIKNLVAETKEYNEKHNMDFYSSFQQIQIIKETSCDADIMTYIDEKMKEHHN